MGVRKSGRILFGSALLLLLTGTLSGSPAEVNVNIGIGLPPPAYVVSAPPAVAVIPGTYVYMVPGMSVDILFYHGQWYRPHEGRWYCASSYNGPWGHVSPSRVPRALIELPPDYRRAPHGYHHVPYGQLKKNWASWERDRYWERDRGWREGRQGKPEGRGGDERGTGHDWREAHEGKGHDGHKPH